MADQLSLLLDSAALFPLPNGLSFSYGTSGFRSDGSVLGSTVHRAGIVAALRSLKTGSTVGLVITASHNPVCDNGVKIADPDGSMMDQSWEPFANALANAPDPNSLAQLVLQFAKDEEITLGAGQSAEVLLARDTRPTGETLLEAAKQGISSIIGAVAIDLGILTTPELHWMVRCWNNGTKATESDYFAQLSNSFRNLMELAPNENLNLDTVEKKLIVDGANGVGGSKLEEIKKNIIGLEIDVRNTGKEGEGLLNEGCGADFVQKEKFAPCGFSLSDLGIRCASLDGDADRLVFFCLIPNSNNKIELVDGDKILSLFAIFIQEQLSLLEELPARLGVVQTAYANGAATDYLRNLGLEVIFTPTGVKYLHEKALEYDIGLYFEANGHGTILFSKEFLSQLDSVNRELSSKLPGSKKQKAALRLVAVTQLINQAVGDALSGLLLVEAILHNKGWSFQKWCDLYQDLPSRQLKVKVADRTAILTADAETRVVKPAALQELIDTETAKYTHGRCFVRPSGTEDVVRIYAEAATQDSADSLANSVAQHVNHILGSDIKT
ncbi:hypothetical protein LUZ61_018679 [Rhynchospora tenuis]|uniref:Phosphoacetylglucosamine mutase n=1 Tax=Rhynchospora tenuis TaxID=198213 RepID=A0AAD5Z9P1_9POAL|nr:hypothetical protein LUZ61_018679 [Rhynchospora tenuis]